MCMLTAIYPTRRLSASWEQKAGMLLVTNLLSANSATCNRDATGFGTLDGDVWKWEESAQKLVYTSAFNDVVENIINQPFIAHVRTTSSGLTALDGAHPYHIGHVLLAHNGTLWGYQKFVKKYASVLNDPDPVDSHVLTCLLAQACGDNEVTPKVISEALKEMRGSYTLLVIDTLKQHMWAVLGSNSLHTMVVGPYLVVNTSGANLRKAAQATAKVIKLLYGKSLALGEVTAIPNYTINTVDASGVTKVGEAPKLAVLASRSFGGLPWTQGKESSVIRAAEDIFSIILGRWVTMREITTACDAMDIAHWWEADEEETEILEAIFSDKTMDPTQNQTSLWLSILKYIPPQVNPYTFLGNLLDLEFPYPLNSEERLLIIYNAVKELEDVVTSVP